MTDSQKLDLILSKMQGIETKMQGMETKMQHMDNDLQEVKRKVINIDLTLENEIRVNIRRVAEGHLDLSRHLHDAKSRTTSPAGGLLLALLGRCYFSA